MDPIHGISPTEFLIILKAALPSVERLLLPLETCGGHLWRTEDVENFRAGTSRWAFVLCIAIVINGVF